MSEAELTSSILQALRLSGVTCWRHNGGNTRGRHPAGMGTGTPDIVGILRPYGRWLALEVKLPGKEGTVTTEQQQWLDVVTRDGGAAAVVTSVRQALAVAASGAPREARA